MRLERFWYYDNLKSYFIFLFGFTMMLAFLNLMFIGQPVFVESLGAISLLMESILGIPQVYKNFSQGSAESIR